MKWSQAIEFHSNILIKIIGMKCRQHKHSMMGYVERQEWAERKIKQGHKQKQCPDCGYWFFKCDF